MNLEPLGRGSKFGLIFLVRWAIYALLLWLGSNLFKFPIFQPFNTIVLCVAMFLEIWNAGTKPKLSEGKDQIIASLMLIVTLYALAKYTNIFGSNAELINSAYFLSITFLWEGISSVIMSYANKEE